jgi:tripartite-type tricarboxylate transporter receptor subunit TctC
MCSLGAALAFSAGPALAQEDYPNKPITMIMPFAPGSGFDTIVRYVSDELSKVLGQQVVVENVPGAGGVVGSERAAHSEPDGYTLMFHSVSSAAVNAAIYENLNYDPVEDFVAISLISTYPTVMITNNDFPAKDINEFIQILKDNAGEYNYGSSGVGSGIHLAVELFKTRAGVDILHIPLKGTSETMKELLGGRIQMTMGAVPSAVGAINDGQVRALAVSSAERSSVLPDVPTLQEAGLEGYDLPYWNGIFAPKGTPQAVIDKVAAAAKEVMAKPETIERMRELGAESVGSSPEELDTYWKSQLQIYEEVARAAGVEKQ